MNHENNSRRDFLVTGLLAVGAGIGVAAGCNSKKDVFSAAADGDIKASGKKVKLLSVDGEVIEVDEAFLKPVPHMPPVSNAEARVGIPGKKFVMVIDLSRCKNLKKCQAACNHAHDLNPGEN
ncbi:MAG TPA: hypothetical protein VIJ27_06890, partial [Mucilaginibacter sp.]